MTRHQTTVASLFAAIDAFWPFSLAESWDQVGLVVGDFERPIERVLLVVDVTDSTVQEAVRGGYDAVVAHHPLLLRGVTSVSESTSKGSLVARLIRANCSVISAHTNADKPRDGVADVLATQLGLQGSHPIERDRSDPNSGIGRVGMLDTPISVLELADRLGALLPETASGVRIAGPADCPVQRIALCPGAGDSLLEHPDVLAADAFITADLRHHPASESRELSKTRGHGPVLLDVSHWASEWPWLTEAAKILKRELPEVEFVVSTSRTDVWEIVMPTRVRRGEQP